MNTLVELLLHSENRVPPQQHDSEPYWTKCCCQSVWSPFFFITSCPVSSATTSAIMRMFLGLTLEQNSVAPRPYRWQHAPITWPHSSFQTSQTCQQWIAIFSSPWKTMPRALINCHSVCWADCNWQLGFSHPCWQTPSERRAWVTAGRGERGWEEKGIRLSSSPVISRLMRSAVSFVWSSFWTLSLPMLNSATVTLSRTPPRSPFW